MMYAVGVPPLDGADHVSVTVDPLDVAVKLVGVPGAAVGVGVVPPATQRDVLPPAVKRRPVWFAHTACALASSAPPPPARPDWPDDMTSTTIGVFVSICLQRHGGENNVKGAPDVAAARTAARPSSAGGTTTNPRSPALRSSLPI